jgi:catalase
MRTAPGWGSPVLQRAFEYWRHVDEHIGDRIEQRVRAG